MAEWICRTLRDGGLEGEHAPALTINDTISTSPLGSFVFDHILSHLSSFILSQKSQSKGIVLVAMSRSPLYYEQLLKSKGFDIASSSAWFKVLDCYTDPLGWKSKLMESGSIWNLSPGSSVTVNLCKNVKDLDELWSSILELGKEYSADGKGRFVVAIDSVSEMLRHTPVSSVTALLSNLRSHEENTIITCLILEILCSPETTNSRGCRVQLTPNLLPEASRSGEAPTIQPVDEQRVNSERRGKFRVRVKRRNGRVRMMFEELYVEKSGIKFMPVSSKDEIIAQSLVPKVQFNLELSEKERNDRAKVVLPFEHQGNGKNVEIYDGRKSQSEGKDEMQDTSVEKAKNEFHVSRNVGHELELLQDKNNLKKRADDDKDKDEDL
ncbi:hypothetical protein BUALT_Bualt04G0082200 [Buddleja alternifolia]|uniref:Elongator complex protein 5 n=1 Tax=Buddleja alternifolia TaxID=168488 RepID=A0AAV6XNM0_9LAMI|nr:hypothetical protein BUALT_Bualt04G0082200 [Buddleja alternifolia]